MLIYCMSRREVLKEISSWMADLEKDKQIDVQIQRDVSIDKTYLINLFEKEKENIEWIIFQNQWKYY